jgi:hypothetical protein
MGKAYLERERYMDKYKKYFRGSNFATPHVINYGDVSDALVYELSESGSTRFLGYNMVGVTVHNKSGEDTGMSQCFFSMDEARAYIHKLKEEHGQRTA